ncbi:hypothetical protein [uncultured Streptomyces sp.]|uniref:hypothetical protein n=1 Tax=uncultured Streptomyces sp. TaxID=174707 RepID=UPI002629C926|nr:hypothetical protein [uncultured Streptomyces sp.]
MPDDLREVVGRDLVVPAGVLDQLLGVGTSLTRRGAAPGGRIGRAGSGGQHDDDAILAVRRVAG